MTLSSSLGPFDLCYFLSIYVSESEVALRDNRADPACVEDYIWPLLMLTQTLLDLLCDLRRRCHALGKPSFL